MEQLATLKFCIVGCGGAGATFAEMLVRSGAKNIWLVDGDDVSLSNLNRVFGFSSEDDGKKKVRVLKERFETINSDVSIHCVPDHFRKEEYIINPCGDEQKTRDHVHNADIVYIGMDKNDVRIECEKLCKDSSNVKTYLSVGVRVEKNKSCFECTWKPETPEAKKKDEGYGENNASYISIVAEATSVAFSMLLHHLDNPKSKKFKKYYRKYIDFVPIETALDGEKIQLQ